jgi:hypothetical protein
MLVKDYLINLERSKQVLERLLADNVIHSSTDIKVLIEDDGNTILSDMFSLSDFKFLTDISDSDVFCNNFSESDLSNRNSDFLFLN